MVRVESLWEGNTANTDNAIVRRVQTYACHYT